MESDSPTSAAPSWPASRCHFRRSRSSAEFLSAWLSCSRAATHSKQRSDECPQRSKGLPPRPVEQLLGDRLLPPRSPEFESEGITTRAGSAHPWTLVSSSDATPSRTNPRRFYRG